MTNNNNYSFAARVGTKYYSAGKDNDTFEIIRIIKRKNAYIVSVVDDEEFTLNPKLAVQHARQVTIDDLIKDYRMILPHAQLVTTGINTPAGVQDVMVTVHKISTSHDMECTNEDTITFGGASIICRQFLVDIFATMANPNLKVMGLCITRESCPKNVNFDSLMQNCIPIKGTTNIISVYAQDDLNMIIKLINSNKADAILAKNFNEVLSMGSTSKILGIVDSVSSLLSTNQFIFDYWSIFGIYPVKNITVKFNDKDNSFILTNLELHRLEYILKERMTNITVIPYDNFIDDEKLNGSYHYMKIHDDANKFYIIQYIPEGNFDPSLYPDEVKDGLEKVDLGGKGLQT